MDGLTQNAPALPAGGGLTDGEVKELRLLSEAIRDAIKEKRRMDVVENDAEVLDRAIAILAAPRQPGEMGAGVPDYAWESITPCYTRFVTHEKYLAFSPAVQKWYRPICKKCAATSQPSDMGQDDTSPDCPHETCDQAACKCVAASAQQDEREAFEEWYSENGKYPNSVRRGPNGGYQLAQAHSAWEVWKARGQQVQSVALTDSHAEMVGRMRSTLYAIAHTYGDEELRTKAAEAFAESFELPRAAQQVQADASEYERGYKEECQTMLREGIGHWKGKYEALLAQVQADAGAVYGPYDVAFVGAGVWAGLPDELPPELVGKKVWLTTAHLSPAAESDKSQAMSREQSGG